MRNYFAIAVLLTLMACNNNTNSTKETTDTVSVTTPEVENVANVSFNDAKLQEIYNDYITLKNALVLTSFEQTKEASKNLESKLNAYKGCENTAVIAKNMADAKDIATQRKDFTALNSDVIALFKNVTLTSGTIFVQHCPMANKGDGGDWLSSEKKIQNPYYGDEMMECGSVIEEIKTK